MIEQMAILSRERICNDNRVGHNHHRVICRACGQMHEVDCAVGYTA